MYKTIIIGSMVRVSDKAWNKIADYETENGRPQLLNAYQTIHSPELVLAKVWDVIQKGA